MLLADLVHVESLMIGELPAEVYHMRIHNQSSTITVLHDSFQILTTVTEHSLTGSMFELGYQYQTHFQGADFFLKFYHYELSALKEGAYNQELLHGITTAN